MVEKKKSDIKYVSDKQEKAASDKTECEFDKAYDDLFDSGKGAIPSQVKVSTSSVIAVSIFLFLLVALLGYLLV